MVSKWRIILNVLLHVVVIVIYVPLHFAGSPVERGFYCDDRSIARPYHHSTINDATLYCLGLITPLLMIIIVETKLLRESNPTLGISTLVLSVLSSTCAIYFFYSFAAWTIILLTDILKFPFGRLRPNFLDVCQPLWGEFECSTPDGRPIYVTEYTCQGNADLFGNQDAAAHEVRESRLSFPSGHASHSFQAATFVTLYLQARLVNRHAKKGSIITVFVFSCQILSFVVAALISITRLTDNKHHASDVLAGAVMGSAVQAFNVIDVIRLYGHDHGAVFCLGQGDNDSGDSAEREPLTKYGSAENV